MSDVKPAWAGELRMAFQDTDRLVFYTHPDEEPEGLVSGRRYACVFVEIENDESAGRPDRNPKNERQRMPSNIAAMLCKDRRFQTYAAKIRNAGGKGVYEETEENAIRYIYEMCDIESRAELDIKDEALQAFQNLIELPFYRDMNMGAIDGQA